MSKFQIRDIVLYTWRGEYDRESLHSVIAEVENNGFYRIIELGEDKDGYFLIQNEVSVPESKLTRTNPQKRLDEKEFQKYLNSKNN
jgi:hypothetical protein